MVNWVLDSNRTKLESRGGNKEEKRLAREVGVTCTKKSNLKQTKQTWYRKGPDLKYLTTWSRSQPNRNETTEPMKKQETPWQSNQWNRLSSEKEEREKKVTEVHKKDITQNGFDLNHHAKHFKYTQSLLKKQKS